MKRARRTIAAIAAIAVVLTLSAAFVFVALEADHDCCGHGCTVCSMMAAVKNVIKAAALITLTMLIYETTLRLAERVKDVLICRRNETPVAMKTKLLN